MILFPVEKVVAGMSNQRPELAKLLKIKSDCMKSSMTQLVVLACSVGIATAASTVIVTDGDGNSYGQAGGFRIDFDSTPIPVTTSAEGVAAGSKDWIPALVSGHSYSVDSVSIRYSGTQLGTAPKYAGVYSGFNPTGGALSGFLGVSTTAIDFSTAVSGAWQQFNFSNLNIIADGTVGSGSGVLYFVFQTGTAAIAGLQTEVGLHRNNGFPADDQMTAWHSNILAFGTLQTARAQEYQAALTPVPEASSLVLAPR